MKGSTLVLIISIVFFYPWKNYQKTPAILQSENPSLRSNPEQLAMESKQLRQKVLYNTDPHLLRDLHQKHLAHIEGHGHGRYGLSGGGGKGSKNPNIRPR